MIMVNMGWFYSFGYFLCFILAMMSSCSSSQAVKPSADSSVNTNLPPDPGKEGEKTIVGIDLDADGVRDDIQRSIVLTYPEKPEVQKALFQQAKASQEYVRDADDSAKTFENAEKISRSLECLHFRDPENASSLIHKLHAELLNTKDRILASDRADSHLGGHSFKSARDFSKSCVDN